MLQRLVLLSMFKNSVTLMSIYNVTKVYDMVIYKYIYVYIFTIYNVTLMYMIWYDVLSCGSTTR